MEDANHQLEEHQGRHVQASEIPVHGHVGRYYRHAHGYCRHSDGYRPKSWTPDRRATSIPSRKESRCLGLVVSSTMEATEVLFLT